MASHFCTCFVTSCDKHPSHHDQGCDLCIQKNLSKGEIPTCFWIAVGGDLEREKEFTIECFADYVQRNRRRYLQAKDRQNQRNDESEF